MNGHFAKRFRMADRKVTFETTPEKFFGALLERVLRNEAHLHAITEHLAKLVAHIEEEDAADIVSRIQTVSDQVFEELSAEVIAKLTQSPAETLLSSIVDPEQTDSE